MNLPARLRLYRFQHALAGSLMLVNAYTCYLENHTRTASVLLLGLLGVMCLFTAIFYEPLVANFPQANALGFGLEGLTLLGLVLMGGHLPEAPGWVGYLLLAMACMVLSYTLYRHPESR